MVKKTGFLAKTFFPENNYPLIPLKKDSLATNSAYLRSGFCACIIVSHYAPMVSIDIPLQVSSYEVYIEIYYQHWQSIIILNTVTINIDIPLSSVSSVMSVTSTSVYTSILYIEYNRYICRVEYLDKEDLLLISIISDLISTYLQSTYIFYIYI